MTKEQKIVAEMQKLELSDWWKVITETLKEDIIHLETQLKMQGKTARTIQEIAEVNYLANKIELMEDMIVLPQAIRNRTEPLIKDTTPTNM